MFHASADNALPFTFNRARDEFSTIITAKREHKSAVALRFRNIRLRGTVFIYNTATVLSRNRVFLAMVQFIVSSARSRLLRSRT